MADTAPPTPITTSWHNANVRQQVITQCTAATRPTGVEGRWIAETDTDRYLSYDGTGWTIQYEPAQAWTPTWTNLTVGNGTQTSYYKRSGGIIDIFARFVFGTTSAITGSVSVAAPINALNAYDLDNLHARYGDASAVSTSPGFGSGASTSSVTLFATNAAGTYLASAVLSSLIPFTWAVSDVLLVFGRYRMTTIYS